MASPGLATGVIRVNLFDGKRVQIPDDVQVLLRVLNGSKRPIFSDWVSSGGGIEVRTRPTGGLDDFYTVIAYAGGFGEGSVYPVHVDAGDGVDADILLLPRDGRFHFGPLRTVATDHPAIDALLINGAGGAAQQRLRDAMEARPQALGALLVIAAAIEAIPLAGDSHTPPLGYYWELEWDLLAQDRFWAWVDPELAEAIARMERVHAFAAEPSAAQFHPGVPGRINPATRSWKETRFDFANVQLTFHENDRKTVRFADGRSMDCVMVEPDIDYYKDVLAHGLLEVLPNWLTRGKTDPRTVYALRWIAARRERLAEFNPPCVIEA